MLGEAEMEVFQYSHLFANSGFLTNSFQAKQQSPYSNMNQVNKYDEKSIANIQTFKDAKNFESFSARNPHNLIEKQKQKSRGTFSNVHCQVSWSIMLMIFIC